MTAIGGFLIMMAVPAYFVVQPLALWHWRGGWQTAALVPLVLTVPAIVFSLVALHLDSNLWPLTLIFAAFIGFVYLGILWLLLWWMADQ